jgi:arabinan endo-1,5-alpha-L-arabinosidase
MGFRPHSLSMFRSLTFTGWYTIIMYCTRLLFFLLLVVAWAMASAIACGAGLTGQTRLHDPSTIIKEGDRYHLYYTGNGVSSKFSNDLINWQNGPRIFNSAPAWTEAEVPANNGSLWAPEIFKYDNEYRLYYSVSSFGNQDSAIGLAINTTLDFTSPNYQWIDRGLVIDSEPGFAFNAIDPNIFHDKSTGRMWMTFGSFWSGVFITELNPTTGKPFSTSATNIARHPVSNPNAIEAPYLYKRDGFYYLFVNWGNCCDGVNSTYEIRVGRSTSPTGPFITRGRGNPSMVSGGGDLFLDTEGNFIGPGHISIFSQGGADFFSFHYYDGNDFGRSKLNIRYLHWDANGWPVAGAIIPEPSMLALVTLSAVVVIGRARWRCDLMTVR